MSAAALSAIDPVGPLVDGAYLDDLVEVRRVNRLERVGGATALRSRYFVVDTTGAQLRVWHSVPPEHRGEGLTTLLVDELGGAGVIDEIDLFERVFVGIVRTFDAKESEAIDAWTSFYRAGLEQSVAAPMSELAAVRTFAAELVPAGSVLELGSCFGFLSLHLALNGHQATASDLNPGTMHLLGQVAHALGAPLQTAIIDAADVPLADRSVDTVLALHLLEHVDDDTGERILREALRVARRRTIIAVPLEETPDPTFGHVRCITLDDLTNWGQQSGRPFGVREHHGGWLVVEA
ncbi:mycofactocin oligosaccharide methyltransferase MftM [Demetria terragena]|uniref:mycofactocin oligosaccharide methyltransferase MftM n=1 Tax=Demetria terragena TaxID=63959 RepID=UPI00036E4E2C|nr:mycofactocin oligosaccharide methyltransferase MftM [Demetria terragena]